MTMTPTQANEAFTKVAQNIPRYRLVLMNRDDGRLGGSTLPITFAKLATSSPSSL
jgi:hypothetical protein